MPCLFYLQYPVFGAWQCAGGSQGMKNKPVKRKTNCRHQVSLIPLSAAVHSSA